MNKPVLADITLSNGRVVQHTRELNGFITARCIPGRYSFTMAEYEEYENLCAQPDITYAWNVS